MKEDLFRAIYEANEIDIPRCFIILDIDLADNSDKKKRISEWIKDVITDRVERIITAKTVYFYLVDELTGVVVKGGKYPIKIKEPTEFVKKLLPLMQYGMKVLTVYNGFAGFCQLLGIPLVSIPSDVEASLKKSYEVLKEKSSSEMFKLDPNKTDDTKNVIMKAVGASLRELKIFLEANDEEKNFGGLFRVYDNRGSPLWTKVGDTEERARLIDAHNDNVHERPNIDMNEIKPYKKSLQKINKYLKTKE